MELHLHFNSIKVRLERREAAALQPLGEDFNSIKVRLELKYFYNYSFLDKISIP